MKKLIAFVLLTALMLCVLPSTALATEAAEADTVYIGGIKLSDETVLFNGDTEAVSLGEATERVENEEIGYAYFFDGNLILANFEFTGESQIYALDTGFEQNALIYANGSLNVVTVGECNITCESENAFGILARGELYLSGTGLMELESFSAVASISVEGKSEVNFNGGNYHFILGNGGVGISALGFFGEAMLNMNAGSVYIEAIDDAAEAGAYIVSMVENTTATVNINGGVLDMCGVAGGIGVMGTQSSLYRQNYGTVEISTQNFSAIYVAGEGDDDFGNIEVNGGYLNITVPENTSEQSPVYEGSLVLSDTVSQTESTVTTLKIAENRYVTVGGISLTDGDYLANGADAVSDSEPENIGYAYYENGKLVLNNYEYFGDGGEYLYDRGSEWESEYSAIIYSYSPLEIEFIGENILTAESEETEGIVAYGTLDIHGATDNDSLAIHACYGIQAVNFASSSLGECSLKLGRGIYDIDFDMNECYMAVSAFNESSVGTLSVEFDKCNMTASATEYGISIYSTNTAEVSFKNTDLSVMADNAIEVISALGTDVSINNSNIDVAAVLGINLLEGIEKGRLNVVSGRLSAASVYYDEESKVMPIYADVIMGEGVSVLSGSLESEKVVIGSDGATSNALGDVNNDGKIDQYDYILVKRHYFGTRYLTDDEMTRGDVNRDGKVDQYDYILICRHYFGTFVIG